MGTNCVKTKGLKKIFIFFTRSISLSKQQHLKKFLSLSQNIISNCLKKFIHRYGVLHTTGSTIQHQKKKTKTTYRRSYVNLISLSNISIKLFLLRKYILHRNSKRRFLIDFYIRKQY